MTGNSPMADGARADVLGLKAQAAQRAFEARGMSLSKALRRGLSRTADLLWDLALVTQSVTVERLDQDGVIKRLVQKDLLLLLDGPDGAIGLAAVDRAVLTGLVEVQTIQQVTQMPVDDERVLTQTDAAMAAPLLDGTLTRMATALGDDPLSAHLGGFRFGALLEDPRSASLLLDAADYRLYRAEVDLALGRRKGVLAFILPNPKPRKRPQASDQPDAVGPHADCMARVPARLEVVLSRIRLPLAAADALKPGDLLRLSPDVLDRVEVRAAHGHPVAKGRLGQLNGFRAVRLTWPVLGPKADADHAQAHKPESSAPDAAAAALPALADALPEPAAFEDDDDALPDLPPMSFDEDLSDFDIGDGEPMEALPEMDFDGEFGSAPMEMDFED